MKLLIIVFFLLVERCFSQQLPLITISINDTIKKTHFSINKLNKEKNKINKRLEKKIKIKVNLKNNSDSLIALYFFDKQIVPSHCNLFLNTYNLLDSSKINDNYFLNCSGLRAIFYDSLNNHIKPQYTKSKTKRYRYFKKFNETNYSLKLISKKENAYTRYTQRVLLNPHEIKKIKMKIYLIKVNKYPLFYSGKKYIENLYGFLLEKGSYNIELNYFFLISDFSVPDYIKYSNLYLLRLHSQPKINDFVNNTFGIKIFEGNIKSNKIRLIVE